MIELTREIGHGFSRQEPVQALLHLVQGQPPLLGHGAQTVGVLDVLALRDPLQVVPVRVGPIGILVVDERLVFRVGNVGCRHQSMHGSWVLVIVFP